jgi:hypothetical protein
MAKRKTKSKSGEAKVEVPPVVNGLLVHAAGIEALQNEVTDNTTRERLQGLANRATKLAGTIQRSYDAAVKKAGLAKKKVLRDAERKSWLEKRMADLQAKLDALTD